MNTVELTSSFASFDRFAQKFHVAIHEFLTHQPEIEERLKRRDLDLNGTPIILSHPGSAAIYPVQQYHKERGALVLVQHLPSHSKSSIHYHPLGVTEEYDLINGVLVVNSKEVLRPSIGRIILPKEVHRVHTDGAPALTLIIIRGANGIPYNNLHIRLDPIEGEKLLGQFVQ